MSNSDASAGLTRPLVQAWVGKIEKAIQHKKPFTDVAEQCMAFFSGATGFMWDDRYRKKFMAGKISPRFKVTIAKAFELVALYGPALYYRNPSRSVKPYEPVEWDPDVFGDPNDPNVQQMVQQAQSQDKQTYARDKTRAKMMERYLSYTPSAQPNGGLEQSAEDAITEMLIKGFGCLWARTWRMPGSNRLLTGLFYDSQDNLLIDPDAESPAFGDAMWIAQRHVEPTWEVERRFGLKPDALKGKGSQESALAQGARQSDDLQRLHRRQGQTFDLITYYEIYSLGGVGTRLVGMNSSLGKTFDEVVGDYAYIVIAPGVDYPLNCPADGFVEMSEDDVRDCYAWPAPYWAVRRWPVSLLYSYRAPRSIYPISPLAPGLGELTALNIIVSHLLNRTWSSSRDFIAVLNSAAAEVEDILRNGEDLAVFKIKDMHKNINEVVSFLQQPPVSHDMWSMVDRLSEMFDKRVGLSDLLYGVTSGAMSRSAADAQAKQTNMQIRPDHMSKRVASWLTHASENEKLLAYWSGVSGQDVAPILGPVGAQLWDTLVAGEEPDVVMHRMSCTVEANDVRRPNKERDSQNIGQVMQVVLPFAQEYSKVTGDTGPVNALLGQLADTIEQPTLKEVQFGPMQPPAPPPEVQQQQQAMSQAQLAVEQGKAAELNARAQQAAASAQGAGGEAQAKAMESQQRLQGMQFETQLEAEQRAIGIAQDQQAHSQRTRQSAEEFRQKMEQDKKSANQELRLKKISAEADRRLKRLQPAGNGKV